MEHVFAHHAHRRSAALPTPSVLVGDQVVAQWTSWLRGVPVAQSSSATAEAAAMDYLEAPVVRDALKEKLASRLALARAGSLAEHHRTPFEREVWLAVSCDALLSANDFDGHLLLGWAFASQPLASPLRAFAAAHRILAAAATPLLLTATGRELDRAIRAIVSLSEAAPTAHVAVSTSDGDWSTWFASPGREHAKAMVRPCVTPLPAHVEVDALRAQVTAATIDDDDAAKSAAERLLFEALERVECSRGRFSLNQRIDVAFGGRPLEIDLACDSLHIAVEIDGHFHFRDADAWRRDRRKDVLLQKAGYLVVRVLAEDVMTRVDDVVRCVHDAMAFQQNSSPAR